MAEAEEARHERVLVVEDDPGIAELIEMALSDEGYRVEVFASADAAAPAVRAGAFDLLLTDLRMRGASPFALAAEARRQGLPVLVTTGDAARAEEIGSDWRVLLKPFRIGALLHAIKEALAAARASFGPAYLRGKAQQCRRLAERAGHPALAQLLAALAGDLDGYARRMAG